MKQAIQSAILIFFISIPLHVHAVIIDIPLNFSASTQSIWGSGGSTFSFGDADTLSVGVFDVFSYDIGASSGTVSAALSGMLSIESKLKYHYSSSNPIHLSYTGIQGAGQLKSDLGAWAKAEVIGINILDRGYALNIDEVFTPQLGQTVVGSDSFTPVGYGVDVIVAEVGVGIDITQTNIFSVNGINGLLSYSRRGNTTTNIAPFLLDGSGMSTLNLGLSSGIWDIGIIDISLDNTFSTSFDANLNIYEEHPSGVEICYGLFGIPYPCGIKTSRNEKELASIDIYNGSPFSLAFNDIDYANKFSIHVVPEPTTIILMMLGLSWPILRTYTHNPN